ncbi:hypothetical protein KP509_17G036600 [Ceratopteris richardii]|uniref:PPM-type phosphatase domain-containing protein n=1 Tax=Ceratopteris richardii TaxID=49495 RepID=A0A8T2SYJ0_CERRI|nr:hypothetical protein KP509_17G036600 [Ceratopteris richardii]
MRPGGYFVWSATPGYWTDDEDVEIWKEMEKLTLSIWWKLVAKLLMSPQALELPFSESPHPMTATKIETRIFLPCSREVLLGSSGTIAITVLILAREIFVANAGDCRVVLCNRGKAIEMSRDHKPHVERSRIEALGGYIYDGYLNGYLSVARAFENWHIEGLKGVNCPLNVEPEVRRVVLTPDDEFMIIGCDGFWDVFTNESAVAFAQRRLQQHNDPEQCSHDLVEEALRRCLSDNLTVVTVCFQKIPPPRLFPRFMARRCMHFEKQL